MTKSSRALTTLMTLIRTMMTRMTSSETMVIVVSRGTRAPLALVKVTLMRSVSLPVITCIK